MRAASVAFVLVIGLLCTPVVQAQYVEEAAAQDWQATSLNVGSAGMASDALGIGTEHHCPDCDQCQCFPCECPTPPAPCQPCPHVSTVLPYWNVNIFGALQANMMYNTARPVAPGIPLFLAPGVAQPENTVDIQARSSSLGALFTGPEVGEFRSSGLVMALFYNDALIVDRYGVLPIQAWGDLKNEDWRFAAGLQFNVFNPNLPNMLTFSALLASGNAGNNFPGSSASSATSILATNPTGRCSSRSPSRSRREWFRKRQSPRSSQAARRCGSRRTTAGRCSKDALPMPWARRSRKAWKRSASWRSVSRWRARSSARRSP